jgi:hypothetical protein
MCGSQGDKDLAKAHVDWFMARLRGIVNVLLDEFEPILIDHMEHGIKHGRELAQEEFFNDKA